jgi:hypothetical protein
MSADFVAKSADLRRWELISSRRELPSREMVE